MLLRLLLEHVGVLQIAGNVGQEALQSQEFLPEIERLAWRMVSTLACMSPSSGNIAFGLPDIRSGLQCLRNPAGIPARNGVVKPMS